MEDEDFQELCARYVATIYLYEHQAKSGCCQICADLDGWFTAEEEEEPPYEISQHDYCRCTWKMHPIIGLWRDSINEIMNEHADDKAGYDQAVYDIAFHQYDIDQYTAEYADLSGQKDAQDRNAETYASLAEEQIQQANDIIDQYEGEEIPPEVQESIDELLWQAEDNLARAEACIALSDTLFDMMEEKKRDIKNEQDQQDADKYLKEFYWARLLEVAPILEMGCIEDKAAELAGSKLIMEF
jgi:hypothetical protein